MDYYFVAVEVDDAASLKDCVGLASDFECSVGDAESCISMGYFADFGGEIE